MGIGNRSTLDNKSLSSSIPHSPFPIPHLMGILNATPDSFYDGGKFYDSTSAIAHAQSMIAQGADMIDIGGESTRPGAAPVSADEEIKRTIPIISALKGQVKISVDTRHAAVMRAACEAGAEMINDISALTHDTESMDIVKQFQTEVILMHMQGNPQTMQDNPTYENVANEIYAYLAMRIDACLSAGIAREKIIVDPGIGFGKTLDHNLQLLRNLERFKRLGCRILIGVSRKSFIGKLLGDIPASDRLPGSLAAAIYAANKGASILRVHDVWETRQAISLWQHLCPAA